MMSLFRRRSRAAIDEELRLHLDLMVEESMAGGMDRAAAEAEALRRFGDVGRIADSCLEEDTMGERKRERLEGLKGWFHDLRYGARALRRSPVYSAVIVITLAFGIGVNAVVFSALSPYFLRALPFSDPDRLVHLFAIDAQEGQGLQRFSLPQYADLRERTRGVESLAAYAYGGASLSGDESAELISIGRMSANAFHVLGARAAYGRVISDGEDGPGAPDVIVLGHGLWQRLYGGDPSIVGRAIRVDGVPHVVIGVMPEDFNFPFGGVKAWVPIREDVATEARDRTQFLVFGRLADGWTAERLESELAGVWRTLAAEHPDEDGRRSRVYTLAMRPALNFAYDLLRVGFLALSGAVGIVLLIACANITGLGLARAIARRREVAVRAALGAPRRRLVRQFLAESGILAVLGGGGGLLFAHLVMGVLGPVFPEDLYAVGGFGLDPAVVAFTAAVTGLAALLIGILPALSVTGTRPGDALREGGRSGAAGQRAGRTRSALVVGEMALGLVLVVAAGLMARSLARVSDVPLGFEPDGVVTVELRPPANEYADAAAWNAFYDRAVERIRTLPGVSGAGTVANLPLNHETFGIAFSVPGRPLEDGRPLSAEWFRVSSGYFETMEIGLLAGRTVGPADGAETEPVAVINRTLAERHFPDGDAVGAILRIDEASTPVRVVGVVEGVRHSTITEPPPPQIYLPLTQSPARRQFVVVRAAAGDPSSLAAPLRAAIADIDPDIAANLVRPMSAILNESVGPFAAMSIVLGIFGAFALLLAAIGLYGLIAYSVSQRQAEFGVRMALGAAPRSVVGTVVAGGLRLAVAGIVLGLAGALAAGRLLTSLLFGTGAADPVTLGLAAFAFLATTLLATLLPAARASRADPLKALRSD